MDNVKEYTLKNREEKFYSAEEIKLSVLEVVSQVTVFDKWLEGGRTVATEDEVLYEGDMIYVTEKGLRRFIASVQRVQPNADLTCVQQFIKKCNEPVPAARTRVFKSKKAPEKKLPEVVTEAANLAAITVLWQGVESIIHKDESGMYNLTDVWRASGLNRSKEPSQWAANKKAKELIEFLENRAGEKQHGSASTVYITNKGFPAGTWGNELILNEYLMWMSVEYKVAVHEAIVQFVREQQGPDPQAMLNMSQAELFRLCADLSEKAENNAKELEANKPYTSAGKQLADTTGLNGVNSIAGTYGLQGYELNYILLGQHIIKRSEGGFIFTAKYAEEGLGQVVKRAYGDEHLTTRPYCWFTGVGLVFINELLASIAGLDADSEDMHKLRGNEGIKQAVLIGRRKKESHDAAVGRNTQESTLDLHFGDVVRIPADPKRPEGLRRILDTLVQEVHDDGTLTVASMTYGVEPQDQALFRVAANTVTLVNKGK